MTGVLREFKEKCPTSQSSWMNSWGLHKVTRELMRNLDVGSQDGFIF